MSFKLGDHVAFRLPRGREPIYAKVVGELNHGAGKGGGRYLVTRDGAGVERRVRPSICIAP